MQINELQSFESVDEKPVKQSALDLRLLPYPLLHRCARSASRFDEAVGQLRAGAAAGSIRNAVLQDAKAVLARGVQRLAAAGRRAVLPCGPGAAPALGHADAL